MKSESALIIRQGLQKIKPDKRPAASYIYYYYYFRILSLRFFHWQPVTQRQIEISEILFRGNTLFYFGRSGTKCLYWGLHFRTESGFHSTVYMEK